MPFKSWGTSVDFTQKRDVTFTEMVPYGKVIGLYGYQPVPAILSSQNLSALQNYNLATIANAIQASFQGQVNYLQLSWNESGMTVSDMVLGIVFSNTQNINCQEILNTVYASTIGPILVATNMGQLNAWKAYRLNEAPETNWLMIAGITGGLVAIVAAVYLLKRRR